MKHVETATMVSGSIIIGGGSLELRAESVNIGVRSPIRRDAGEFNMRMR